MATEALVAILDGGQGQGVILAVRDAVGDGHFHVGKFIFQGHRPVEAVFEAAMIKVWG